MMALLDSDMCLGSSGLIGTMLAKSESELSFGTAQVPVAIDQNKEGNSKKCLNVQNKGNSRARNKAAHNGKNKDIQKVLVAWYLNNKDTKLITDDMLKQKAEAIAKQLGLQNFVCSNHWLETFKRQFNLLKPVHATVTHANNGHHQLGVSMASNVDYSHAIADQGNIDVMAPVSLTETQRALATAIAYLAERPSPINRSSIEILQKMIVDISKDAKQHASEPTHTVTTANVPTTQAQREALVAQMSLNVPLSSGNMSFQNMKHITDPCEVSLGEASWMDGRSMNGISIT